MRRAVVISGAAMVALVAALTAGYAVGGVGGARPTSPRLVTGADAVRPQEGRDYRLVSTLHGAQARGASGITSSGEVELTWHTGFHDTPHHALLDPVSGHRTRLPDDLGSVVDATHRAVTSERYLPGTRGRLELWRLDRSSGRRQQFVLPEVRGRLYTILGLDGDTVWFATAPDQENGNREDVYSVRFGRPATVEHYGRRFHPGFADGVLSWVVPSLDGPAVVAMQDVASGKVTRIPLPEQCGVRPATSDVRSNGSQVAVNATCGDRTFVLDRDQGVVAELRVESDEGALELSDRTASFYWYSYDLASGTLYDVSDRTTLSGTPPTTGQGADPLALWPQGSDGPHDDPTSVRVVRLLP